MNYIQKSLVLFSGSSFALLKRAPSDINKHAGIGGVIFFTAVLASLSAGYALFTVFDSVYLAVGFGLLWGLMIFNLDRFIVVSMKKKGNFFNQFFTALPRLIFAVLLGIVISKPLELKIFEKEVNKQLNVIINRNKSELQASMNVRYDALVSPFSTERKEIYARLDQMQASVDSAAVELEKEVVGTQTSTTTGKVGYGANAKRKAELKAEKIKDLNQYRSDIQPRLDELATEIDKLNRQKEQEIVANTPAENSYNGFAARIQALDELGENNKVLQSANIMIMLLFVSLEISPVLVKLIAPKGPYDYLLEKHEHSFKVFGLEAVQVMDLQSEARLDEHKKKRRAASSSVNNLSSES